MGQDEREDGGIRRRTEPLRRREAGAGDPCPVARARRVQRGAAPKRRPAPVLLERRAAHRQRAAGAAPRAGPHLQGRLPPLQAHAGLPLPPQGGLGHPRPAGRARDREGAGDLRQGRDRAPGRGGGVHPPLPRVGDALHRRLGEDDRAHGLLGEHARRLLHPRQRLHRVGVVAAPADLGQGPHLPGLQGGALRPAHRRDAVIARGRARVPGGRGPVDRRALPGRGRRRHVVPGMDHHPVDPAVEPRARGTPRRRLRPRARGRRQGRERDPDPRRGAGRRGAARRRIRPTCARTTARSRP